MRISHCVLHRGSARWATCLFKSEASESERNYYFQITQTYNSQWSIAHISTRDGDKKQKFSLVLLLSLLQVLNCVFTALKTKNVKNSDVLHLGNVFVELNAWENIIDDCTRLYKCSLHRLSCLHVHPQWFANQLSQKKHSYFIIAVIFSTLFKLSTLFKMWRKWSALNGCKMYAKAPLPEPL